MLHQITTVPPRPLQDDRSQLPNDTIDLDIILGGIRRQWKVVALATAIGVGLGLGYMMLATPLYKASGEMLLDFNQRQLAQELTGLSDQSRSDEAILSQVELFSSSSVAARAVDELELADNIDFLDNSRPGFGDIINSLRQMFGLPIPTSANADVGSRRGRAISIVLQNMSVSRMGRTYLLDVSFTNPDPIIAADVSNALAKAYLTDSLNAQYEATRSATEWLEGRIEELRSESLAAELAAQTFRQENGLFAVDGQLVTEQQLAATNSDLVRAQTQTAAKKSALDRIQQVIGSGDPDAVVTAALDDPQIRNLRERYLEASARQTSILQRVGPEHEQARQVNAQIEELQRLMQGELRRIAAGYQSDYEIALANEQALRQNLEVASAASASQNSTQVQLRELESRAASIQALYQSFLQSYQESAQRASFPIASARIITPAGVPGRPSAPNGLIAVILGAFLGGAFGVAVGGAREFRDRFIRTAEHLRADIGIEFLGLAPKLNSRGRPRMPKKEDLVPNRIIPIAGTVFSEALEHPTSQFAETLRTAKVAADLALAGQKSKVIGMVSLLPEEGKSTVSVNLAMHLASLGGRVLLIDGDIRHPMISRSLVPHASVGMTEMLTGSAEVAEAFHFDDKSGLHMLPVGKPGNVANASDLLSSQAFANFLSHAQTQYNYIVIDLPPIAPVVDARAVAPLVDAFIFVVQWGRIPRAFLRNTLRSEPQIADKTLGAVLNKVDMDKLKLYRSADSSEYYASSYAKYFRN